MAVEYKSMQERERALREELQKLAEEMAEQKSARVVEIVDELVAKVEDDELELSKVADELNGRIMPKSKAKSGTKATRPRRSYRCRETGEVYKGGKVPNWLVDKMKAARFDPTVKGAARMYAEQFMDVQEAA